MPNSSATIFTMIKSGGVVLIVLILCSIWSLGIIVERIYFYRRQSSVKRTDFMEMIGHEIQKGNIKKAITICEDTETPFAKVAQVGLHLDGHSERLVSQAMEREIVVETIKLERFTSVSATIGSTAIYIGLLGTVIGIMRAFHDISISGVGGINVIIGGISQSLVSTAAGLLVAIPAVVAYNFFVRTIDVFVSDMELCASELVDLLCIKHK
jgi:biopolymer transport protein ExbB/TolQ